MKVFTSLFILLLILNSCKKEVEGFAATNHQAIITFDATGKPDNLEKDVISSNLLSFINSSFPEQTDVRKSHPELLTKEAIADITITQKSDIFVTFVSQGSGNTNTVGFYTYPTNNPPKIAKDIATINYFFPNAGLGSTLQAGDKIKLGTFEAGTSIGFVLLPSAWDGAAKKINNSAVHFCTNDILNPESDVNLKKHSVLINYTNEDKVLIGFEDMHRNDAACDHDFNDVVMYTTVSPK